MRAVLPPVLVLSCLIGVSSWAQGPAATPEPQPGQSKRKDQQVENIRHEDQGSRIDELRVGGETRQITVSPKGNAPAYELAPEGSNRNPANADRERSGSGGGGWQLFKF